MKIKVQIQPLLLINSSPMFGVSLKILKIKVCVEFGTHKGQTTKVLSHCFKKVFTINKNEEFVNWLKC